MYRQMVLIRHFEELALSLRNDGRIHGVVHPYSGQEAIAVGVCANLRISDRIVSNHRGHGHCIAKGADIQRMMAELFGRRDGYCKGKGGSMHIADFDVGMLGANGIVGAGLPIAAGAAVAAQLEGSDAVAVGFFGDGATGEGPFHESLNIAALLKLPVIWVCENNQYAGDTPIESGLAARNVADLGAGYGMPGYIVDGNDVLAVFTAATRGGAARQGWRGSNPARVQDLAAPRARPAGSPSARSSTGRAAAAVGGARSDSRPSRRTSRRADSDGRSDGRRRPDRSIRISPKPWRSPTPVRIRRPRRRWTTCLQPDVVCPD